MKKYRLSPVWMISISQGLTVLGWTLMSFTNEFMGWGLAFSILAAGPLVSLFLLKR